MAGEPAPVAPAQTVAPAPVAAPAPVSTPVQNVTQETISNQPTAPIASTPTSPVAETVPVVAGIPAPALVTPAVEPAKPAEPVPAEAPKTPSLLAEAKAPESKPAEAKPETKPEPPKAPEPLKYEFKFPEGSNIPEERIAPYAEILGKHQVPPEAAQQLVDLYAAERQRELKLQHENWEKTQQTLQAEFKTEKEIGGDQIVNHQTGQKKWEATVEQCGYVLDWFGQKHGKQHEQSLRNAFIATGLGNHAEFIRLLADMSAFVPKPGDKIVAASIPTPLPMGKAQRRYPTMQPNGAA